MAVDTKLDGSFLIRNKEPGTYYVVAEMTGYLSPLAALAAENIRVPSAEDKEQLRTMLQQVTVIRGRESRLDLRLERGASLSGTVRYDDGSPAAGLFVSLLRKEKDGTLKQASSGLDRFANQHRTDDLGHYRVTALTPAEYMVSAQLRSLNVIMSGPFLGAGGYTEAAPTPNVQIYSGSTARRSEAKLISVGSGQDITGADVTIPISKLHTVRGILIAKQDGHPLSSGSVVLVDPSDKTTVSRSWVQGDDGGFTLEYVIYCEFPLRLTAWLNMERAPTTQM